MWVYILKMDRACKGRCSLSSFECKNMQMSGCMNDYVQAHVCAMTIPKALTKITLKDFLNIYC